MSNRGKSVRWHDPWGQRWVTHAEYVAVIEGQIVLSRTWRYRLARAVERLRRKPVRADTAYLIAKLDVVESEE